jgi:signal transduction histidine kinase/ActR/RegA family two-component response regulator
VQTFPSLTSRKNRKVSGHSVKTPVPSLCSLGRMTELNASATNGHHHASEAPDDDLRQQNSRSTPSPPLIKQGELVGVLYFDGHLASEVFMPASQAMMELPSVQTAILLQNADLRAKLERERAERKREQEEVRRLESRLRQAERFEAMGTLVGGIAHDVNNILAAILGFGERALRSVEKGSRLHHDLTNVIAAGERGRTLVDRVLSFSRGIGDRAPVHVEKVVREALELLQAKLPPRITLRTRLSAERAAIYGDATQIHQLLMNLGTNAVHAMPREGALSIALDAVDVAEPHKVMIGSVAPGAWLVLKVEDEGTGIPAEILPQIFDPFFTTKEVGVGTGLGLSLVLRIVTEIGGAIDVESDVGVGTAFTVYLPRAGDAPEEPHDESFPAPEGQGQRVLVVDHESALLELATDTLRELGYRPFGFASAGAALRAFRADPGAFDVLITEHRMPSMPGDELIREVRRVRPTIPVILVSGYMGGAAEPGSASGAASDVLVKPLRASALATSLARVLEPVEIAGRNVVQADGPGQSSTGRVSSPHDHDTREHG